MTSLFLVAWTLYSSYWCPFVPMLQKGQEKKVHSKGKRTLQITLTLPFEHAACYYPCFRAYRQTEGIWGGRSETASTCMQPNTTMDLMHSYMSAGQRSYECNHQRPVLCAFHRAEQVNALYNICLKVPRGHKKHLTSAARRHDSHREKTVQPVLSVPALGRRFRMAHWEFRSTILSGYASTLSNPKAPKNLRRS